MSPNRTCALAYASGGLEVLPLRPRSKMPLIPSKQGGRGYLDATADLPTVESWWARVSDANVGIRPPTNSNGCKVVVVDIDVQNDGHVTWRQLLNEYGPTPPTLTARTGQGGAHLWFWMHGNPRSGLGQGVDCKTGTNGYVVVPPSMHPETGRIYTWISANNIAWAPNWLNRLLEKPTEVARRRDSDAAPFTRSVDGLVRTVYSAQDGERNKILFWAACRLSEAGEDVRFESSPLSSAAMACGLEEVEIRAVFRSAGRRYER